MATVGYQPYPCQWRRLHRRLRESAGAVFDRAAVFIRTYIGVRANELFEQVAIRSVQAQCRRIRRLQHFSRPARIPRWSFDVGRSHRLRGRIGFHPFGVGIHFARGCDSRWGNHSRTRWQIERMRNATAMHELNEYLGAVSMNRLVDWRRRSDLRRRKDSRNAWVAEAIR